MFKFGKTKSPVQAVVCRSFDFLFFITDFLDPVACDSFTDFEIKMNRTKLLKCSSPLSLIS